MRRMGTRWLEAESFEQPSLAALAELKFAHFYHGRIVIPTDLLQIPAVGRPRGRRLSGQSEDGSCRRWKPHRDKCRRMYR
jgi:hypothetical protein